MATKEQTIQAAQRTADREHKPMAVLNLNTFGALYVIRDWDERFEQDRQLVARINPRD